MWYVNVSIACNNNVLKSSNILKGVYYIEAASEILFFLKFLLLLF